MLNILDMIYSRPFFWGALAGTVLWKLYCHSKARLQDRHDQLPDGKHHAVARMSRQWVAGLCMALSLGYVLLATGRAEERTTRLNQEVTRCWQETYLQIRSQVLNNAENDKVSRGQQALQREYDKATSLLVEQLVSPPSEISPLGYNDPVRVAWKLKVTDDYQARIDELGRQFDAFVQQRVDLDKQREMHPLPEARCGRTS
jgi:hypothetical protein